MKHKLYKYILVCASLLTSVSHAMKSLDTSVPLPAPQDLSACAKCALENSEKMINYLNACTVCPSTPDCSSACPQIPQIEAAQEKSCEQRNAGLSGPMCQQAQKIAAYCNGSWLDIVILQLYQKNLSPSLAYQQLVYANLHNKMMLCQKLASGTAVSALPSQLKAVAAQPENSNLVSICSKGFISGWSNDSINNNIRSGNFVPPVPLWSTEAACIAAPTNPKDPNYAVCQGSNDYTCAGCCLLSPANSTSPQDQNSSNNCCMPATCSKTAISCLTPKGQQAPGAKTICKPVITLYASLLNNAGVLQVLWNSYLELGYNSNMSVISEFKKIMNWKLSTWQGPNGATANSVNNYLGQLLATTVNDLPEFATGQLANPNLFPMQVTFKEYLAYYNAHPDELQSLLQDIATNTKKVIGATSGPSCGALGDYCLNNLTGSSSSSTSAPDTLNQYCIANIQVGTQSPELYSYISVPSACITNIATIFSTIGTNIGGAISTATQSCSQITMENQTISKAIQAQGNSLANCNLPTAQASICLKWQKLIQLGQTVQMGVTINTMVFMIALMVSLHFITKSMNLALAAANALKAAQAAAATSQTAAAGTLAANEVAGAAAADSVVDAAVLGAGDAAGFSGVVAGVNVIIDAVAAASDTFVSALVDLLRLAGSLFEILR